MENSELNKENAGCDLGFDLINKIIHFFSDIDKQILSLYQCSSEDFKNLDLSFRKYYKLSKALSKNSEKITNIFLERNENVNHVSELTFIQEQVNGLADFFENKADILNDSLENILKAINLLSIPINNMVQDLLSFDLLLASKDLKNPEVVGDEIQKKKINDFIAEIRKQKEACLLFNESILSLRETINREMLTLKELEEKIVEFFNSSLNKIIECRSSFIEKKEETKLLVPQVNAISVDESESIDSIITQLQYQDIIKQKIDHIDLAHKDLMAKLNLYLSANVLSCSEADLLEFFSQISEVSGLQAAQLVFANKEYQKAISIINKKFVDVSENMIYLDQLCHKLSSQSLSSERKSLLNSVNALERNTISFPGMKNLCLEFGNKVAELANCLNHVLSNTPQLEVIETSVNDLVSLFENSDEKKAFKNFEHFFNLRCDYIIAKEDFLTIIRKFRKIQKEVFPVFKGEFKDYKEFENQLTLTNKQLCTHISALKINVLQIDQMIEENNLLSKNMTQEIKYSIEQVKYYKLFKVVAEDIIKKLTEVKQLFMENDIKVNEQSEDLKYLTERYTMNSEHIVHQVVTENINKKTEIRDTLVVNNEVHETNEGEVEFF